VAGFLLPRQAIAFREGRMGKNIACKLYFGAFLARDKDRLSGNISIL